MTSILSQDEIADLDQKILNLYESSSSITDDDEQLNKGR